MRAAEDLYLINGSVNLVFDTLAPREEPVWLGKSKDSQPTHVLREVSEGGHVLWMDSLMEKTEYDSEGKPTNMRTGDSKPFLVSLCLFEMTDRGEKPVPLSTIKGWPSRVVTSLYNRARTMSGMDGEETVEEMESTIKDLQKKIEELKKKDGSKPKNSPSATTDTSV